MSLRHKQVVDFPRAKADIASKAIVANGIQKQTGGPFWGKACSRRRATQLPLIP